MEFFQARKVRALSANAFSRADPVVGLIRSWTCRDSDRNHLHKSYELKHNHIYMLKTESRWQQSVTHLHASSGKSGCNFVKYRFHVRRNFQFPFFNLMKFYNSRRCHVGERMIFGHHGNIGSFFSEDDVCMFASV